MKILFWLTLIGSGPSAFAFPEMVRAGYQNCVACHVSPSGGGALNEYGRSMASELLSTWNYKGEEKVGHGLFGETPKWLQMGGDIRYLRSYFFSQGQTDNEQFVMETDIEPVIKLGKLTLVGSFGIEGGPANDPGVPNRGEFISRHHYAMYSLSDETYVRAGKYEVPFGINQPNHEVLTRQGLGFDEGSETYNIEAGYIGEKINVTATVDLGRFDDSFFYAQTGNGAALNVAYNLFDGSKIGYSTFHGSVTGTQRWVTGPYAIIGFTKHFVLLSELYYQWLAPTDSLEQKGPTCYNRLQYEFVKGVHGYLEAQYQKSDMTSNLSETDAYAVGFNFYPRPHLELLGNVGKMRVSSEGTAYGDVAWLQAHYYF